jgi:hypothetical protein
MREESVWMRLKMRPGSCSSSAKRSSSTFLADRVVVMSASPSRIIDKIAVPLQRARQSDVVYTAEFVRPKRHCAGLIRKESLRAFEQQNAMQGTA